MEELIRFTWSVDDELLQLIKHQAVEEKISVSVLIGYAVVNYLEEKGVVVDKYRGELKSRGRGPRKGRKKREVEGIEGIEEGN